MTLYRNAFYWMIALLVILLIGFWPSYFSRLTEPMHVTLHLHSIAMLAWVLLLIAQSWLIRNRKLSRHRALGRASLLIAPLVVITGIWVNFHFQGQVEDPQATRVQAIFWFGFFLPLLFAFLYVQAIRHRRNMNLHARYMVLTALVFLIPGLGRALNNTLEPFGLWTPTFLQLMGLTLGIALWLMIRDWRRQKPWWPQLDFSVLWAVNIALYVLLPKSSTWNAFSAWAGTLTV
jgi:hypothetical protein